MIINKRGLDILTLLGEEQKFSIKELAKKFNVNSRSIRYDLDNLNFILAAHKLDIIEKNSYGQMCLNIPREKIQNLIHSYAGEDSEKRTTYLTLKILMKNFLNLTEEAKYLKVNRETLKPSVKELKDFLNEKGVSLKSSAGKGIFLSGDEKIIRELLKNTIFKIIKEDFYSQTPSIKKLIENCFKNFDPELLRRLLTKAEKVRGAKLSQKDFDIILCTLVANIQRKIFSNCIAASEPSSADTKKIMRAASRFGIFLSQAEAFSILKSFKSEKDEQTFKLKETISIYLEDFKTHLINNFIFSNDFMENLSLHAEETELQNKKDFQTLKQIIISYMEENAGQIFPSRKALLVSDCSRFICKKIKKEVKDRFNLDIIETLPVYLYEIYGSSEDSDLIISTENISEMVNIPLFKLSMIPTDREYEKIFQYLCFKG